jgi:site-specific DNA-methyltransferase (adenine-specific)
MWATYPKLADALKVISSWGFIYKTVSFTWVKKNPSGVGWKFGLGYWTRGNPEICLLATRGKPSRVDNSVPNLLIAPVGNHSAKPPAVRDRIVQLMGDVPRIELFAREQAIGWKALGDEIDGKDMFDAIPEHLEELKNARLLGRATSVI